MNNFGDPLHGLAGAGGGFRMHDGDEFSGILLKGCVDFFR